MKNNGLVFLDLLKEIVNEEEGMSIKEITENFMYKLYYKDKHIFTSTKGLNLNTNIISILLKDKSCATDYLNSINVPCVQHNVYFNIDSLKNSEEYYDVKFNKQKIVIKDNLGALGRNVFVVSNADELIKKSNYIFNKDMSVAVCPYEEILNEYRLIIYKNEIRLLYKKEKLKVIGDGNNTIKTLIHELEKSFYEKGLSYDFSGLNDRLEEINLDISRMPQKGEEVYIDNLFKSLSENPCEVEEEKYKVLSEIGLKISRSLDGIPLCVDIIEIPTGYKVLECSGMLAFHNILTIYPDSKEIVKPIVTEIITDYMKT